MIGAASPAHSVLQELKAATSTVHARVESALPSLSALGDRASYFACLEALHGFYATWEPTVWRALASENSSLCADERRKVPALRRDLGRLQAELGVELVDRVAPTPVIASVGTALGVLYVFEGATLGGRVVERNVSQRLRLTAHDGLSFFHGYGERTGEMWGLFGRELTRWAALYGRTDEIVSGAVMCFLSLEQWLLTSDPRARASRIEHVADRA
ncbi:MAG: biliverdin-producing heme oxygenase [Gemmatimonadaceae bacterium]